MGTKQFVDILLGENTMNTKASIWITILFIFLALAISGCGIQIEASEKDRTDDNLVPEPGTIALLITGLIAGGAFFLVRPGRKK